MRKQYFFPATIFLLSLVMMLLVCVALLWQQGVAVYDRVKIEPPEPLNNVGIAVRESFNQVDQEIGYVLKPRATGAFLVPLGAPVVYHVDASGFRAALHGQMVVRKKHVSLLFLGDSYTFGSLVPYENSFAGLAAEQVNGETLNAGVPGYSIAQMLLLARRLIPKYQPDYVVVQYSPWLVARAESGRATDAAFTLAPYFYDVGGEIKVAPVPFVMPEAIAKQFELYKTSPRGLGDMLSFFVQVGVPFFIHNKANRLWFGMKQWLGLAPEISTDSPAIIRYAYGEIDRLVRESGGKTVVLALGTAVPLRVPTELLPKDALLVNGWKAMVEALPQRSSYGYIQQYFLWRAEPPVPVDWHPNERAHAVIAKVLSGAIKRYEASQKNGCADGCAHDVTSGKSKMAPSECAMKMFPNPLVTPAAMKALSLPGEARHFRCDYGH